MPNKNELRTALKDTRISALFIIGFRLLNSINRSIGLDRLRILIKTRKSTKLEYPETVLRITRFTFAQ